MLGLASVETLPDLAHAYVFPSKVHDLVEGNPKEGDVVGIEPQRTRSIEPLNGSVLVEENAGDGAKPEGFHHLPCVACKLELAQFFCQIFALA